MRKLWWVGTSERQIFGREAARRYDRAESDAIKDISKTLEKLHGPRTSVAGIGLIPAPSDASFNVTPNIAANSSASVTTLSASFMIFLATTSRASDPLDPTRLISFGADVPAL